MTVNIKYLIIQTKKTRLLLLAEPVPFDVIQEIGCLMLKNLQVVARVGLKHD